MKREGEDDEGVGYGDLTVHRLHWDMVLAWHYLCISMSNTSYAIACEKEIT